MFRYNLTDVESEAAVSAMVPDLSADELATWQVDQAINRRGVAVDRKAVDDCREVVRQASDRYTAELVELTDGAVPSAGSHEKLRRWLAGAGCVIPDVKAETIADALAVEPEGPARRALEIRTVLSSASVLKAAAIARRTCSDGRLRDLFVYCGADRTGRWAGRGPQPQNLPAGKLDDVDAALAVIATRDLDTVERAFGDALDVVAGCLRGLFVARPGHDLICSDYSAIEAVVLAELAGEQWRRDLFRTHGKIYEMSAAKISGVPFEDFVRHRAETGEHHPLRKKIGKVAELACFTRDTQLLTSRGYVSIADVRKTDFLWDGEQWVKHQGVVEKGKMAVLDLDGIGVTPTHPISLKDSWKEAEKLASNESTLLQALEIGSENLPLLYPQTIKRSTVRRSCALAGTGRILSRYQIYAAGSPPGVESVAATRHTKRISRSTKSTGTYFPTTNIGAGSLIGSVRPAGGAITKRTPGSQTTAAAVSPFAPRGGGQKGTKTSLGTSSRSRVGTSRNLTWIGLTRTTATGRGTSGSVRDVKTCSIKGPCRRCNAESTDLRTVYDIAHAGPRNRFTVKTSSGHLIVHNSGYQGWIGAWRAFGADDYFENDDDLKDAILKWRSDNPAIVEFWGEQYRRTSPDAWEFTKELYGVEGHAVKALQSPGESFEFRGLRFRYRGDVLSIRLPSGRSLSYHEPRLTSTVHRLARRPAWSLSYMGHNTDPKKGRIGWTRLQTYGPKLCENCSQAISRDILAHALKAVEAAGYPVVLHVHDEIVAEVPKGFGSVEDFERIMGNLPPWCADWPVRAVGGWVGNRYRKE